MSKISKRKHVIQENFCNDYELPKDNQIVVKIICSKGNNLHEVVTPQGESYLASMPVKFRKSIWVKRNDFVLVEPIEEGDKVKAEIVRILNKDSIKFFMESKIWPEAFVEKKEVKEQSDDDLFVNPNRVNPNYDEESDSDTSSSDSESESD